MLETDFWQTNLDIYVQEGKRAITTKKVTVTQEREAGLDMLGMNVMHRTAAPHRAKVLNSPFVLQKEGPLTFIMSKNAT